MGHHKQRHAAAAQVAFEPLDDGDVEVVGGLVKDEQVGLRGDGAGDGEAFALSARQVCHGIALVHVQPHLSQQTLEQQGAVGVPRQLGTGRGDRCPVGKRRLLLEQYGAYARASSHRARVGAVKARDDAQHSALARAVFGYYADFVALVDTEGDILKKHAVANTLGQLLNLHVYHKSILLLYPRKQYAFVMCKSS